MKWVFFRPMNGIWMIDYQRTFWMIDIKKSLLFIHFCIIQWTHYFRKCFRLFISTNMRVNGKLSICVVSFIHNDGTRDFLDEGFSPLLAEPYLKSIKICFKIVKLLFM